MKRLLLIGGVISMVLPAMADIDLSGYDLRPGDDNNNITCGSTIEGNDAYFADGEVEMIPLYVKKCAEGQYYNATSTVPSNHPVWDSDGEKCTNPVTGEVIANATSADACDDAVLDYYYINVCADIPSGSFAPAGDPVVTGGKLKSTTLNTCAAPYNNGSDGYKVSAQDCYKYCGTVDNHTTVSNDVLNNLNAISAVYTEELAHNNGEECVVQISGCKSGYNKINLNGYIYDWCSGSGCDNGMNLGDWTLTKAAEHTFAGTSSCGGTDGNVCTITVTTVDGVAITDTITADGGTWTDNAECLSNCGKARQHNIAEAISTAYSGMPADGVYCEARKVDITWKEQNLAEDDPARTCVYGDTLTFPETEPTKTGYSFIGWTVGKVQ